MDHLNLSNKFDKEMALTNNLLVNLDELDAIRPSQQQDIMQILAKFGPTDGLAFDHYEADLNFA